MAKLAEKVVELKDLTDNLMSRMYSAADINLSELDDTTLLLLRDSIKLMDESFNLYEEMANKLDLLDEINNKIDLIGKKL